MQRPAEITELVKHVRLLELIARRNAVNWLTGEYVTSIRGGGLVFHEARKYVAGESARLIDWNITARLGEPYVKVHREERQRDVMVLLDVSPSMHLGFQRKTKLEFAVELAASLAVTAIEGGDRLGYVLFADRVLAEARPLEGKKQLFSTLRDLLEWTAPWDEAASVAETDPRVALHALGKYRRGRFVVFLISDYLDHDVPEDLRYVAPQHDVTLLHVYDPFEYDRSAPISFTGFAPEGAREHMPFSAERAGSLDELRAELHQAASKYRMSFESLSTTEPVSLALNRLFRQKRRELAQRQ
jgi:uncharacterized protein (DUF58 family)